jgi:hypothetical protein
VSLLLLLSLLSLLSFSLSLLVVFPQCCTLGCQSASKHGGQPTSKLLERLVQTLMHANR